MRRMLLTCSLVATMLMATGCGDNLSTHDGVANAMVTTMKEFVATLKGITDESSAKAAAPRLKALGERMEKIEQAAQKLGDPPADVEKRLEEKYESEVQKVTAELMGEMFRIGMNPTLSQHVEAEMKKIGGGF